MRRQTCKVGCCPPLNDDAGSGLTATGQGYAGRTAQPSKPFVLFLLRAFGSMNPAQQSSSRVCIMCCA